MTALSERIRAEVRRPRQPLQLRRAALEVAVRLIYGPFWLAGWLARGAVAAGRFSWQAARLGAGDGYRGREVAR